MKTTFNAISKNIEAIYPLAPMQQGLLFHTLMNPGAGMYLLQYRHIMMLDDLNIQAFQQAWDAVVARHELLRTSFVWKKQARPLQVVHKKVDLPVEILDWSAVEKDEQASLLEAMLLQERQDELVFNKAPLMRVRLIKLAENKYQFVRSYHHILMDAWCFSVIMMDFLAYYRAFSQNQVLHLDKPRPYQDFIAWLEVQDNNAHQAFWASRLLGFDTPTSLGIRQIGQFSNNEPVVDSVHLLSEKESSQIQQAASKAKITVNTLLQGAWALLLSRYSGESDVVFGVTVAGRPTHMVGMESVVGLFINTLPLRVNTSANASLLTWLQALQTENLVLREHETSSLTDIQQWSEVSKQDLFHSLFVFENAPMDAGLDQENLEFIVENATNRTHTNYPITVVIIPGETLHLQITYQSSDFEHRAIEKMLQHFTSIIDEMTRTLLERDIKQDKKSQKQSNSLSQLSMLNDNDIAQQQQWGQGDKLDLGQDYIQRLEAQVIATPEKMAVADNEQTMTYRDLNTRANLLAKKLMHKGVGTDTIVALLGERNAEFLVMILGVLKSGAAYLPLDPKQPPLRLVQVIEQSRSPYLLVSDSQQSLAQDTLKECVAKYTAHPEAANQLPELIPFNLSKQALSASSNPMVAIHSSHLAYVIFTSGSTGTPKGVMVTREGMLNNMLGKLSPLGLTKNDVIAQTASQCFDISVWQFLIAPILGARVEILPDCISHDTSRLATEIQQRHISIIEPVPSLLKGIVEQQQILTHLRWVLPTGEALPPALAQQWHEQYPAIPLMNAYGPAECSDDVAFYPISKGLDNSYKHAPIGKATANNTLHLLSPELTPMPVGAIGEIYVAGTGVGRGYLHEPKRTAAVFLPNPFSHSNNTQGDRLYRTGDLGRLLSDGSLQYVGRTDYQVKVRGYRIELGEIESRLVQHPLIKETVVITIDDPQRGKILVAYLGLNADDNSDNIANTLSESGRWSSLRAFISEGLPEYMVPTAFIALPALPRNHNGKVDRAQLPDVDFNSQYESTYVAPRNDTEHSISHIWQNLLGLKKVGIHDNFFELGGHSLLATQLVGQLSQLLGSEITLRSVFENPTIANWSEAWEEKKDAFNNALPPLLPANSSAKLLEQSSLQYQQQPLSFVQQRLWFLQRLEPDSASYNLPAALRLKGALNQPALTLALQQLLARHEVLRTQFIVEKEQPVQYIHDHLIMDVNYQSVSDSNVLNECLRKDAMTPFALDKAPLLRVSLYQIDSDEGSEDQQVLSINCHHIIADAWSLRLLIEEFCLIYNSSVRGEPIALPPLTLQYSDYATWQTQCLNDGLFSPQLNYWKTLLSGDLPTLELSTDYSRPSHPTRQGARHNVELSSGIIEQLMASNRTAKRGHFSTLLAAFELLLSAYSGQNDILIGIPIANRHHSETQSLMGCFINTLVHRANTAAEQTVNELIASIDQQSIDAQANQDLPFDYLIDQLGVDRQLSYNPLFQAMFNYLSGTALDALQLDGIAVEAIDNRPDTALCDIKLDVQHNNSSQNTSDTFALSFEYSTELFEHSTIVRMADDYQGILQWMLDQPNTALNQLNLWENKTLNPIDHDVPISDMVSDFQYLVTYQPDQIAIQESLNGVQEADTGTGAGAYGHGKVTQLSYAQLDLASDRLAEILKGQGVGVGDRVAICADRNMSMIISIMGILKVGGAYVPIDPSWPQERGGYILEHVNPTLCLVDENLQEKIHTWLPKLHCISYCVTTLATKTVSQNECLPFIPVAAHPLQTAYVLYTSGSTGRPKGVEVNRGNINNLFLDLRQRLSLANEHKVLALTSYCFDISMVELLLPLTQGASVVIASKDEARDPKMLERLLDQHDIHLMQATPATWSMLLARSKRLFTDMTLLSAGEVLSGELAKQMLARGARVINFYGPTEVTIYATYKHVLSTERRGVPIGADGFDVQSYILDEQLRPVPQGVIGELYLGGANVTSGYFNAPGITAAAFLPNPFSDVAGGHGGARMYKTGDLVKRNSDGELDYIGRNDFQVKLRGFRIELGEIEALLPQLQGVDNAAVILAGFSSSEDSPKDQLLAYWCGAQTDSTVLRDHLLANLPEYMVPAHFTRLDALPLNSNEKIDRKALPKVIASPLKDRNEDIDVLQTQWQHQLVDSWAVLFENNNIRITDHFFHLGGHSLLAARLVARLSEEYGIDLPLKVVFETPVLADLACVIETNYEAYQQSGQSQDLIIADTTIHKKPMHSTQQRLWFMEKFNGSSRAYQLNSAFTIEGHLDRSVLRRALEKLALRQHSLRTIFGDDDGELYQEVVSNVDLPLYFHSTSHAQEITLEERLYAATQEPFALSQKPSWRINVYDNQSNVGQKPQSTVQLCMHHIIGDAWSLNIMMQELHALYCQEINLQSAPAPLTKLPFQFGDFSAWWQSTQAQQQLEKDSQYWQQQLSGESPVLSLPTDFPRPKQQGFEGQRLRFTLSESLVSQLQSTSLKQGVTAFTPLLSAWQLLLSRYSNQSDVRVGIPVANRHHAHTSHLMGYFASTQVMRSPLVALDTVSEYWHKSSQTLLDAQEHQNLPFEQLVEILKVPRSTTHSPLFQTLFNLIQLPTTKDNGFAGMPSRRLTMEDNTAITDIGLQIEAKNGQWECVLEYNTDLFLGSTAQRYARQYVHILEQMLAHPKSLLLDISPLEEKDNKAIQGSNNTDVTLDYMENDFVKEFEKQAALSPDSIAIRYQQHGMTYRELNQKSNQIASSLMTQSISSEQRVAVCLERGPNLLIALIAIQKAGAVYIPLDPLQPKDRLRYICEHAKPSILLTQSDLENLLSPHVMKTLFIDLTLAQYKASKTKSKKKQYENVIATIYPQQLAYIIYTSGSTGKPKGVSVTRENLTNFLHSMNQTLPLDENDQWLAVTTAGFDISALEFYLPLMNGASVLLASARESMDGEALFSLLKESTVFQATPASWQLLLGQKKAQWPAITGLVGGEAVPGHLANALRKKGIVLHNVYGPTETTIWSTQYPLSHDYNGIAPIGLPINNTRCYVLNEYLQVVPQGASGELYIAGAGVARGYQFAPTLSAQAFMPDMFANDGSRMYKTGDVVRRDADGVLEYIGRTDFQIKIRGFRIELGEIESCIRRCNNVAEAVVVADDQQRLVAYVETDMISDTPRTKAAIDPDVIMRELSQQLPSYMVPYTVLSVEHFPLNSNGKIDRKALNTLSINAPLNHHKKSSRVPESEIEKQLATIWRALLDIHSSKSLGVDDSFFALGGHSLLAMKLITQVEKQFSVRLALQALFENPTITGLSKQIDSATVMEDDEALDFMDQLLNEFED